jgi:hypothetical protein
MLGTNGEETHNTSRHENRKHENRKQHQLITISPASPTPWHQTPLNGSKITRLFVAKQTVVAILCLSATDTVPSAINSKVMDIGQSWTWRYNAVVTAIMHMCRHVYAKSF